MKLSRRMIVTSINIRLVDGVDDGVRVQVDTDPENMLSKDEAVRIFHNQMKKEFSLYDIVVLGVVNEKDPDGVFNPQTLSRVHELTQFIRTLTWEDPKNPGQRIGVVKRDLIAPGNVDSIEQGGPGRFVLPG